MLPKKFSGSFYITQNIIPYMAITEDTEYGITYFPTDRPPVAAAPYVGGVEWEATNYLASHLDLLKRHYCLFAIFPATKQSAT